MHHAANTTLDFCEDAVPHGLQELCAILHSFAGQLHTAAKENWVQEQAQRWWQQLERDRLKRRSVAMCSTWDTAPQHAEPGSPFPLTPQHDIHSLHPTSQPCLSLTPQDNRPGPPGCWSPRLPLALQSPTWSPGTPLALLRWHMEPALPPLPMVGGCDQPSLGTPASRQRGLFEPSPELGLPDPPAPVAASAPFSLASLFRQRGARRGLECPPPSPATPTEGSALCGFLWRLAGRRGCWASPS
ncbi:uncharacterized protein LOC114017439 [Falco cherrug]|uniref:uncharacterized protein LOC114017439 n=1 Tax=Falco cherrug TaxID=345164 RepID=UPI000FFC118F|nr:uncharacterized protein LOC114017439 [Falco cherrug]